MTFREHHYYTYIMASSSGTLYVGMTNCIEDRARQHREGRGSDFTRRYKVNRLVYYECFRYVLNAIRREKEIKGWTRAKKEALIRSRNPKWEDLSREFGKVSKPPPGVKIQRVERDASSGKALLSMTKRLRSRSR
jgi:putative endonuclease